MGKRKTTQSIFAFLLTAQKRLPLRPLAALSPGQAKVVRAANSCAGG